MLSCYANSFKTGLFDQKKVKDGTIRHIVPILGFIWQKEGQNGLIQITRCHEHLDKPPQDDLNAYQFVLQSILLIRFLRTLIHQC